MDLIFQAQPDPHIQVRKIGHPFVIQANVVVTAFSDKDTGMTQAVTFGEEMI